MRLVDIARRPFASWPRAVGLALLVAAAVAVGYRLPRDAGVRAEAPTRGSDSAFSPPDVPPPDVLSVAELRGERSVGLALGGGAVLGAAHIGVLQALEERDVRIDYIAGTSVGALVGALYAFGFEPDRMAEIAAGMDWLDVSAFEPSRLGLLTNDGLGDLLTRALGDVTFEEALTPLAVVATDIGTGEAVVLDAGSVRDAVLASACLPGLFRPIELDGRLLVDGGLVANVPVDAVRALGAEIVIAVDLIAGRLYRRPEDVVDVLSNAFDIAIHTPARMTLDDADLVIAPQLAAYSGIDPEGTRALMQTGYEEARRALQGLGAGVPP